MADSGRSAGLGGLAAAEGWGAWKLAPGKGRGRCRLSPGRDGPLPAVARKGLAVAGWRLGRDGPREAGARGKGIGLLKLAPGKGRCPLKLAPELQGTLALSAAALAGCGRRREGRVRGE